MGILNSSRQMPNSLVEIAGFAKEQGFGLGTRALEHSDVLPDSHLELGVIVLVHM